ncbi:uncharacterized protein [Ptychodera flava]|uniref:uncharacterized protein n=1 Tax=Ptychodera flava TaxID=63121 RepID=UPI00396A8AD7
MGQGERGRHGAHHHHHRHHRAHHHHRRHLFRHHHHHHGGTGGVMVPGVAPVMPRAKCAMILIIFGFASIIPGIGMTASGAAFGMPFVVLGPFFLCAGIFMCVTGFIMCCRMNQSTAGPASTVYVGGQTVPVGTTTVQVGTVPSQPIQPGIPAQPPGQYPPQPWPQQPATYPPQVPPQQPGHYPPQPYPPQPGQPYPPQPGGYPPQQSAPPEQYGKTDPTATTSAPYPSHYQVNYGATVATAPPMEGASQSHTVNEDNTQNVDVAVHYQASSGGEIDPPTYDEATKY